MADPTVSAVLSQTWDHYKRFMIAPDGRPLAERISGRKTPNPKPEDFETYSESVSYVLLRAVWMNDQQTFDKTWSWARSNLQRRDHLFAWKYTPRRGRPYVSAEAASDADLDIAAALILAGKRWGSSYRAEARNILAAAVKTYVKDGHLLAADWHDCVNPGYFRPAYFTGLFAEVYPEFNWQDLAKDSYTLLGQSGDAALTGKPSTTNLPPNWFAFGRGKKMTACPNFAGAGSDLFGWDAFRALFAAAQDYAWNGSADARRYLTDNACTSADAGPYCFLKQKLTAEGQLRAGFYRNGRTVPENHQAGEPTKDLYREQWAQYGAYLAYFHFAGDSDAARVIASRLQTFYKADGYWGGVGKEDDPYDYYGQNWAWFGLALVNGQAGNTFAAATATAPTPSGAGSASTASLSQFTTASFGPWQYEPSAQGFRLVTTSPAESPSFTLNFTSPVPVDRHQYLKFEVKGSIQKLGQVGKVMVQIFYQGDLPYVPSVIHDPLEVSSTENTVSIRLPSSHPTKRITAIKFLFVTDNGTVDLSVTDLRTE